MCRLWLLLPVVVWGRDLSRLARCQYLCRQEGKECKEKCYNDPPEKPGRCGNDTYPFYNNCVNECQTNNDCHNLDLCCPNKCGKTCQMPVDLDTIPGLPEIPTNVTITKGPDQSCMLVDWSHPGGAVFVVEKKEADGPWLAAHKAPRLSHPVKVSIEQGMKYTARVAALNSLGSKGFSQPSEPFTLYLEAKPPDMPENLRFKGSAKNGSVSGLLSWQLPRTEQQVSRYLVVWSQRIADKRSPPHKGPMEVHRKTVTHGKNCLRIKNLKPNAQYTFHVQAQIVHEKKKISSKRATLNVDTSNYSTSKSVSPKSIKRQKSKQKLIAQYNIIGTNEGQSAKISWKSRKKTKYGISWESVCTKKISAVVINGSPYTIPSLEKNCEYNITIREINECKKRRRVGKLTFKTN